MLEMLFRLPYNEYMRQQSRRLIQVLIDTIHKENEGNVRTAIQVLCNLQKTFRPNFSPEVRVLFPVFCPLSNMERRITTFIVITNFANYV